jgi:hypothetical protein
MARSVHRQRLLPLFVAAAFCLLCLPVSGCSSSASSLAAEEPRKPAWGVPAGDALLHHRQLDAEARTAAAGRSTGMEVAGYRGKTNADDGATTPLLATQLQAWAEGVVVAWRRSQRQAASGGRALIGGGMRPAAVLRPSKLARRFLAGVDVDDAGTDGTAASCHSSNVHINCPPASSKP